MVHISTVLTIVVATWIVTDFLQRYIFNKEIVDKEILMDKYYNLVIPEEPFVSFNVNRGEPKKLKMDVCNHFKEFSSKVIKLDNLFRQIHLESNTLFEDMTSVKIVPYCIGSVAYTNDEICFRNTKIHNLENLKLVNIELGRTTIHKKKINRFLYVTHKFDELVINGTIDFVEVGSLDEYNTSILNSHLIIYRDYKYLGHFSLEVPLMGGYSESNTDKYVAHAVDMHLKRSHDMVFYLPVDGFYGLLNQIENEINTPSVFFPENVTFSCSDFPETDVTKNRTMTISTSNMRLNEQLNYDVINYVKFVEMGDSYFTRFSITFNELDFTSKMSVIIDDKLFLDEDVLVEINKLYIEIVYYPMKFPMYTVLVSIRGGLSLYAEKKIDPYFYTPHFKAKLSSCIKSTTYINLQATLHLIKDPQLQKIQKENYTFWI